MINDGLSQNSINLMTWCKKKVLRYVKIQSLEHMTNVGKTDLNRRTCTSPKLGLDYSYRYPGETMISHPVSKINNKYLSPSYSRNSLILISFIFIVLCLHTTLVAEVNNINFLNLVTKPWYGVRSNRLRVSLVSRSRTHSSIRWYETGCPEEKTFPVGMPYPLRMFYWNISELGKKVRFGEAGLVWW